MNSTTEQKRIELQIYLYPIVALVAQLVARHWDLPKVALMALVVPLIFTPQTALLIRSRHRVEVKPLLTHTLIACLLIILASLLML